MRSGSALGRLLELRRRVRAGAAHLPVARRRQLLHEMEAMALKQAGSGNHLPKEMAPGEVMREIKWRLETLSLDQAEAAVRTLDRLERQPLRGRRPS